MVLIKLLELNEYQAIYEYLPEGQALSGQVAINRNTGERLILKKIEEYSSSYAFHALKRIEEYMAINEFKENDMIAWY